MASRKSSTTKKTAKKIVKKTPAKKIAHKTEGKKHISPWWVFWTYLFGVLFLGMITGAGYALHNPGILGAVDSYIGASILEENAESFCSDFYFKDHEGKKGLFEVDGYVCQSGTIVPVEIVYDSQCPECLVPTIENTFKLLMPTSVITKRDIRAGGEGMMFHSLPYAVIDGAVEKTDAMQTLADKIAKVGDIYVMNTASITNAPRSVIAEIEKDNLPFRGAEEADLAIVEYTGTQCPACKTFLDEAWGKLMEEFADTEKIHYVSKIIPIGTDEEIANESANAIMCAHDQGKYFEYLREYFSIETEINKDILLAVAREVGLGSTEFKRCLDEKQFDNILKKNIADIQKFGINTIPTYIVGGKLYSGPLTYDTLKGIIENGLKRHNAFKESPEKNMQDEPSWGTGSLEIRLYSDFDCTQCGHDYRMLREAVSGLENQVKVIFTNYPSSQNAYGETAANAGECAMAEGNFWEFMELMFSNQSDLRQQTLERYGAQAGFGGTFQACVRGQIYLPEVKDDIAQAELMGIEKTPTYFIGGEKIETPTSTDEWRELIQKKL